MRSLLIFFFSVAGLTAFGQLEFNAGVSAGFLTSQVDGDSYAGFNKIAPTGGAHVDLGWSENITTRLEFLYAPKGSQKKPNTEAGDFNTYKLSLSYIEIPVTLMYSIRDGISIDGGLYYALLIDSKEDYNGNVSTNPPEFNSDDLGGHLGATFMFSEHWSGSARYSMSLLPMRSVPDNAPTNLVWGDGGGYNRCIYFFLGYEF